MSPPARPNPQADAGGRASRRFRIVLIKPSHYDDDGYVIRWRKSSMPSNSLASVYALAMDCVDRKVLGEDVIFDVTAVDETNMRVDMKRIVADFRACDGFGFVGLVGVQSNQYPRALDLAKPLRDAGIPVILGGFHVSGLLAMFPTLMPDLQAALDMGVSLFAGEAEARMDALVADAAGGALKPIYNFINDLPNLEGSVTPFLPREVVTRTMSHMTSFDAGRGCPFQCSFCTIINVQGRKSRRRAADDVEHILRQNWAQGIDRFFITDDNFARNKDWEPIFDRIIELRERDGMDIRFMIQVDTLCHRIPRFIEKAKRAGVTRIFIGLENINPDNLLAAKKRQNKIVEYRKMLLEWKAVGIWTYAGYILGFPNDTAERIREDIEIVKRELPVDVLEFFLLTPLPGSEDHQVLHNKGVAMDGDLNKYDLEHVVTAHPQMSQAEWEQIYADAWDIFYTKDHIETVLRRAQAANVQLFGLALIILWFSTSLGVEKLHPLQGGLFRMKSPGERRPGLWRPPAVIFYPAFAFEFAVKHVRLAWKVLMIWRIYRRVRSDPNGLAYTDLAMTPVADDETETLEIFTHNKSARDSVIHSRKVEAIIHAAE